MLHSNEPTYTTKQRVKQCNCLARREQIVCYKVYKIHLYETRLYREWLYPLSSNWVTTMGLEHCITFHHGVTLGTFQHLEVFNQFASEDAILRKLLRNTQQWSYKFVFLNVFGVSQVSTTSVVRHCVRSAHTQSPWGQGSVRFGPALQTMNGLTLYVDLCLMRLSRTCFFHIKAKIL